MRYPAHHKAETHKQLVASAGALVKTAGFGTTGVDALMRSVGLTGGAFYGHFRSKTQLFREIIASELDNTRQRLQKLAGRAAGKARYKAMVNDYFSRWHLDHPEDGCPLPGLSSEVARAGDDVKQAYEHGLKELHVILTEELGDDARAWAVIALGVGAVSIGRALASTELQEELLNACRQLAGEQARD
ncbi:TetR/AcrR family transcriptional regulator [Marinobacter mobilis]|uniref:Transcriptional regulator, TetR family n=1 Tax=Marinobacter mobilis TaxID=488533 RepID=A0A1H3C8N6_9GAMM|nr:TetR/AcrR family transcriptional regulator [Marinobacter mobilis]SDX50532.1 transcriptional regulator, TetR family [Marinobacter mobilis]